MNDIICMAYYIQNNFTCAKYKGTKMEKILEESPENFQYEHFFVYVHKTKAQKYFLLLVSDFVPYCL